MIKKKAHELFDEASFLAHINNQDEYDQALETLDALMDDYDNNIPLIEILSASIERWEESAEEFAEFNAGDFAFPQEVAQFADGGKGQRTLIGLDFVFPHG